MDLSHPRLRAILSRPVTVVFGLTALCFYDYTVT